MKANKGYKEQGGARRCGRLPGQWQAAESGSVTGSGRVLHCSWVQWVLWGVWGLPARCCSGVQKWRQAHCHYEALPAACCASYSPKAATRLRFFTAASWSLLQSSHGRFSSAST